MQKTHQYLLEKYPWYKSWHDAPDYPAMHWAAFLLVVISIFIYTNNMTNETSELLATAGLGQMENGSVVVQKNTPDDLKQKSTDSDLIASVKTVKTKSSLETNEYGDKIIITHATLAVSEWIKGSSSNSIEADFIGGEAGGLTMRSSIEPEPLKEGDQAVVFLEKTLSGRYKVTGGGPTNEKTVLRFKKDGTLSNGMSMQDLRLSLKDSK